MFRKVEVPLRSFYCELKHRPPGDRTGDQEELIETLILQVPKLKDSNLEKQWAFAQLWNRLNEPEYVEKGINQIFIFTAKAGELLMRMETNNFVDEPARKLEPPNQNNFNAWQRKVEKQFKQIYGITIKQWRESAQ